MLFRKICPDINRGDNVVCFVLDPSTCTNLRQAASQNASDAIIIVRIEALAYKTQVVTKPSLAFSRCGGSCAHAPSSAYMCASAYRCGVAEVTPFSLQLPHGAFCPVDNKTSYFCQIHVN